MVEVDITPIRDGLIEVLAILIGVLITLSDKILWALWNTLVDMLSIEHLGQSPAIIFFVIGLLLCIWSYVMKFVVR